MILIGLVTNPKLKEPVLVGYDQQTHKDVNIYRFGNWHFEPDPSSEYYGSVLATGSPQVHLVAEGEGHFETETSSEQYSSVLATGGYPRVHIPYGVLTRGAGYGTALYAGLCLAAKQDDAYEIHLGLPKGLAGVSSCEETRSEESTAWWERAVRLGLAFTVTLDQCKANYFPYKLARKSGLVLARFSAELEPEDLAGLYEEARNGELSIQDVNVTAMNALDVRGLPDVVIETMAQLMIWEGHGRDANMMRLKHVLNLDPDMGIHAAEKLMKKNARGAADTEQALMTTVNARRKLNWSKLAGLPG